MSEEQQIRDGERVAAFLADEAVKGALARLSGSYFQSWKQTTATAEREALWAKARALEDFAIELQAVISTGQRATAERTRRERAEEQQRQQAQRRSR